MVVVVDMVEVGSRHNVVVAADTVSCDKMAVHVDGDLDDMEVADMSDVLLRSSAVGCGDKKEERIDCTWIVAVDDGCSSLVDELEI